MARSARRSRRWCAVAASPTTSGSSARSRTLEVPGYLRRATIGVAPFETRRHRYLEIDFYWSPFKILEYMAMALPVVTIDVPALRRLVRPGMEGLLYPEATRRRSPTRSASCSIRRSEPAL